METLLKIIFGVLVVCAFGFCKETELEADNIDSGLLSPHDTLSGLTGVKVRAKGDTRPQPQFAADPFYSQGSLIPGQIAPSPGLPLAPGQFGTPGTFNNGINPLTPNFGITNGGSLLPSGSVSADTVAFSATRASDYTRTAVTQVRFDHTITDVGYGWYPDRSEFVCYYPGIYYFAFSALSPASRQFKLTLVRNNQEIVSAWGDSTGYQTGSNSALLSLNANDRVYLLLQEGTLHEGNTVGRGYTSFSGFRIR